MKKLTAQEGKEQIFGLCTILAYKDRIAKGRLIDSLYTEKDNMIGTVGVFFAIEDGIGLLDLKRYDPPTTVYDYASYQIRPKAVFKNSKGYYIKANETIYLDEVTVCSMEAIYEIEVKE